MQKRNLHFSADKGPQLSLMEFSPNTADLTMGLKAGTARCLPSGATIRALVTPLQETRDQVKNVEDPEPPPAVEKITLVAEMPISTQPEDTLWL